MIPQGEFSATIGNYGIKATRAGDPAPTIAFVVKDNAGNNHTVYWQGSFKVGTAREIALKALMVCGLKRAQDLPALGKGPQGGALDMKKTVSITVQHEEKQDGTGVFPRVQWINEPGGGGFRNMMTHGDAVSAMAGLGLEADFLAIAQGAGLALSAQGNAPAAAATKFDDDSVPF